MWLLSRRKYGFNTLCVCLILALSFLLVSCSGDDEKSTKNNPNGTTGGETTGGEGTAGTAGNAGTTGNTGTAGTTPATSSAPSGSDHWIFSVPFQKIEAGSFTMGSPSDERLRVGLAVRVSQLRQASFQARRCRLSPCEDLVNL